MQCLHTSEAISQRNSWVSGEVVSTGPDRASTSVPACTAVAGRTVGMPRSISARPEARASSIWSLPCSTKAMWRQVLPPSCPVLS